MQGYIYILLCSNGQYYTGSTKNLKLRLLQHQKGDGANFTKKHLPVKLVYFEVYERIDEAFNREKQVQGWSRKKKEALIFDLLDELPGLSECKNGSHYLRMGRSLSSVETTAAGPFDCVQGPAGDSFESQDGR